MATQTVEFFAAPGQTVIAKLFASGNDTQIASVTATEQTNRKGVYQAVYTDIPAGVYRLLALVGTTPIASWWTDLTLTTATFQSYEVPMSVFAAAVLDEPLAGHTTAGTLGKVLSDAGSGVSTLIIQVGNIPAWGDVQRWTSPANQIDVTVTQV